MPTINCKTCEKNFHVKPSKLKEGHRNFCSRECYWKSIQKNNIRNCKICKKEFRIIHLRREKYCSIDCAQKGKITRKIVNCETCQTEFFVVPAILKRNKGKYCSVTCYRYFKFNSECTLYFVELFHKDSNIFYRRKIGITNKNIKERFKKLNKKLDYIILFEYKGITNEVVSLEQKILQEYKKYLHYGNLLVNNCHGATECFSQTLTTEMITDILFSNIEILSISEILDVLHHKH